MFARISHIRLLRYAGLFTWVMVGAPLLVSALMSGRQVNESQLPSMGIIGWGAYLAFGLLFFALTRRMSRRHPARTLDHILLISLLGCGIAVSHYSATGLGGILMVVAAAVLPWFLSVGWAAALLAFNQLLIAPLFVWGWGWDWRAATLQSMVYAGFCAFSFATGLVAKQQAEARDEQRRLNAELRATRALLAESVRVNERTRIARELHDLLGHHLTALSLNLEVAGHLVDGKAAGHVRQAHTLAKLLLTDVRDAVSQMREDSAALHIAAALAPLAENVPGLDVNIDVPDALVIEDAERAHLLLRSVQEIITNAVRHAGAKRLDICLRQSDGQLQLTARDDGRGSDALQPGNGLRGMAERLRQYGGNLKVQTGVDAGFGIELNLPLADAVTPPLLRGNGELK
ncbi:MAG: sensor histidine kinase [Pseudomonadota bacterium]|nr:sensor histidine kinase [Pseudomonadota bacterium]